MRLAIILLSITCMFSCKDDSPKDKLGQEKMEAVMFDFIRAEIISRDFLSIDSTKNADSSNVALQKRIFRDHKVSKEDFYESFDFYIANTNQMAILMDSIIAKETRIKEQKSRVNLLKDSIRNE